MTSGCQPLDPHLPRVKGKGALFFGPSSSPHLLSLLLRSTGVKCQISETVHETTTRHSKSQMLWKNGDHTVHRGGRPTSTLTPNFRAVRRKRTV